MRWVLEWDNGTVYFFLHWSNWSGYYATVVPMRHSQLWCLTWDVKESPMAVFWRCLDQHPSITFDWLKSSAVAILAMEKFRYCCSSEFLCEWDWLILKELHWPKELLRPAGQKMQLLNCPIFNCSEVITTTQFATDSHKAIIMSWDDSGNLEWTFWRQTWDSPQERNFGSIQFRYDQVIYTLLHYSFRDVAAWGLL